MNFGAIFLTGLTSGGLSCLAVQGGLLTGIIANQKDRELDPHLKFSSKQEKRQFKKQTSAQSFDELDWMPVTLFLFAKLLSHTILGFFLGWLGSQIDLSLEARLIFQGVAAIFMLATAGNLLEIHPVFRYVVFQPPKFVQRLVRNSTKSSAFFTPAILGFLTIFIPCGVTQAMEVLAMSSGNAVIGAMTMFFFVLGTSPLFATVGIATAKLSETFQKNFLRFAAALIIFLALSSLNGILIVLNSPLSFGKVIAPITYFFSDQRFSRAANRNTVVTQDGVQQAIITVTNNGYSPQKLQVKAGIPVDLTLVTENVYSCASSFVLPAFGIQARLGPTDRQTFRFTPQEKGKFTYTCSMGMYTGTLEVL